MLVDMYLGDMYHDGEYKKPSQDEMQSTVSFLSLYSALVSQIMQNSEICILELYTITTSTTKS